LFGFLFAFTLLLAFSLFAFLFIVLFIILLVVLRRLELYVDVYDIISEAQVLIVPLNPRRLRPILDFTDLQVL
jgi:hypothetical protein